MQVSRKMNYVHDLFRPLPGTYSYIIQIRNFVFCALIIIAKKNLTLLIILNDPLGRPRRRCEDNIRMQGIGLIRLRIGIIGDPL